jgi:hypothetical protein
MENNQKKTLENFIIEFLPPTENKIKRSGNELQYVARTLDKLFIQNFHFNVSKTEITEYFSRLGYQIFDKVGIVDFDNKRIKPAFMNQASKSLHIQFTYFNISPKTVRKLMLMTSKLSKITNSQKNDENEKMKIKLEIFKNKTSYIC